MKEIIKSLEKKYNISIIYDSNEKTYSVYKENKLVTNMLFSLTGIPQMAKLKII